MLEREIPETTARDAMGCYPLFSCRDWSGLVDDLAVIDSLVSLALVADPFGHYTPKLLAECFPDVCRPFKQHFVVDLERRPEDFVCAHHQRNVRKGLRSVEVKACNPPGAHLDDWVRLYGVLAERHGIRGISAFSHQSFAEQLATPGVFAFRAVHDGETVGMVLWFVQGEVAYYHLGAFDARGYALHAAFALFWRSLEFFRGRGLSWINLGGAAGETPDANSGLGRFKQGWSTGTRTAWLCGRIFDRAAYAALLDSGANANNGFFPAYRASLSE